MKPVKFPGATHSLVKPINWNIEKHGLCEELPIMVVNGVCVSCWELTDKERKMVAEGKNIYVRVFGRVTQPPIMLSVED